jgi:RHS repeat-associated protein
MAEYNNQSSPSTFYTISSATSLIAPSQVQWLVADHLGTPRMILDQTGALANMKRHDYLPFGEELFAPAGGRTVAMGYASGDGVRQQFTLKERDVETELDYFINRYYSATQGRFTSSDPEGAGARESDPQSWNGYAYAGGNPVLFSDPDGRNYRVCDPNGKNCTTVSEQQFEDERRPLQETGNIYTGSGNFYESGQIRNAEGGVVAQYVQFSIDDLQHRQLAAIAGAVDPIPMATLQFFGLSAVMGATGGVAYFVLGPTATVTTLKIGEKLAPPLVRRVLDEIKNRNGSPPPGHKGGSTFRNDGRTGGEVLPRNDATGKPITYRKYDVNPYQSGVNRGGERIVRGSDGSAYYTNDHYRTFTRIE